MTQQPQLDVQEWQLVLHLLESERGELQAEVRRTREPHMHDDLQARERMIDGLIVRLRQALPAAAG
jgi:hypothetical protein